MLAQGFYYPLTWPFVSGHNAPFVLDCPKPRSTIGTIQLDGWTSRSEAKEAPLSLVLSAFALGKLGWAIPKGSTNLAGRLSRQLHTQDLQYSYVFIIAVPGNRYYDSIITWIMYLL